MCNITHMYIVQCTHHTTQIYFFIESSLLNFRINSLFIYLVSSAAFFSHFLLSRSAFDCWVMCDLRYTILFIFLCFSQPESDAVLMLCYELRIQFYLLNVFFLLCFGCLVLLSDYVTIKRMRNAFILSLQIFIGLSYPFFIYFISFRKRFFAFVHS